MAADAATATTKAAPGDHKVNGPAQDRQTENRPVLDSTLVRGLAVVGPPATSGVVFTVSANNGVPYVNDPRSTPTRWQNLRRVPGSQGAYVTNITATEDVGSTTTAPTLRITARTSDSNIFYTVCTVTSALPTTGALPCTTWAPLPS
ncbi:hypothetical protein MPTA5024_22245 [Microbispora sp. ATCC PTA-5024]|nr:hypothetical protein MPTA5024_22245 [Microbispora sp. ATCC PTA-5024]